MTYYLSQAYLVAHRAPTRLAGVILAVTVLPVWVLTAQGGLLAQWGL